MKKNDYLLLTATAAYSFLFYQQNAGINFLLFTIVFLSILIIRNSNLIKDKKWLWGSALCLISAACIFIHSSTLSIIANIFSLILIASLSINTKTSSLFAFIFSCFSIVSSAVFMIIDAITRSQIQPTENTENKKGQKILAILLVLILSILFFIMYKSANPLFAENTKWINLDFISVGWIFFTLLGLLIAYGMFYSKSIDPIVKWENNLPLTNEINTNEGNLKQYETERFAGMLLFIMLNIMLLVLNIGDITTLYFNGGLPKGVSHSDFVHNGVGVIILSISIASSLIMFLYRKQFLNVKNEKLLLAGIYFWIGQNLIMLSSTAIRNNIYVHDFNLTYKRIGVFVWLVLSAFGLFITFYTLYKKRSNWFLIRTNFAVWFTCLTLSSCVNWDKLITHYNLTNKSMFDVDYYYLFSLSDTNIPELLEITHHKNFGKLNNHLKNFTNNDYRDNNEYYNTYSYLLTEKIDDFLKHRNSNWKSFDLRENEVVNSIFNIKN